MSAADENPLESLSREEVLSAMFANLVFQSTNMALLCLGRVPHPDTGEKTIDLDAARVFIDQLEMLEVKTKGNLSKEEEHLLQEALARVRIIFVETVRSSTSVEEDIAQAVGGSLPRGPQPAPQPAESRRRFSNKQ